MQNFKSNTATVIELRFFMKKKKKQQKKKKMKNLWKSCLPVFHSSSEIFIHFLHAVTFLHVLHLDILRRQIEIETESKNNNFLMYGYNAGPPMAIPIYTVLPYCVIHVVCPASFASILLLIVVSLSSRSFPHTWNRGCTL